MVHALRAFSFPNRKQDMTLKVRIQVPKNSGPYEAKVEQTGGSAPVVLEPGDEMEVYVHSGNELKITEVPLGTKASAATS